LIRIIDVKVEEFTGVLADASRVLAFDRVEILGYRHFLFSVTLKPRFFGARNLNKFLLNGVSVEGRNTNQSSFLRFAGAPPQVTQLNCIYMLLEEPLLSLLEVHKILLVVHLICGYAPCFKGILVFLHELLDFSDGQVQLTNVDRSDS